jgi:hypothetical protein
LHRAAVLVEGKLPVTRKLRLPGRLIRLDMREAYISVFRDILATRLSIVATALATNAGFISLT